MTNDKIKLTKQEFEDLYEVEKDLTQPEIEDKIDKPEEKPDKNWYITEEEKEQDNEYLKDYQIPEDYKDD